jgi:hypothetical protein
LQDISENPSLRGWKEAGNVTQHRGAEAGLLAPGVLVRHPQQPDWGLGQVQSVVGERVTVNFEHRGKVLINAARIGLEVVDRDRL